jgi:hypothetical protein
VPCQRSLFAKIHLHWLLVYGLHFREWERRGASTDSGGIEVQVETNGEKVAGREGRWYLDNVDVEDESVTKKITSRHY